MTDKRIGGVIPALITPFKKDYSIDEQGLRENVEFVVKNGVNAVIPSGSTGEFYFMSRQERRRVIEITVEQVDGRVPVLAGTAGVSTQETIDYCRDAEAVGADALMIVTPYYSIPTDAEVINHYKEISAATKLPIILYNKPAATGKALTPELVAQLSEIDRVDGIKDTSFSLEMFHAIKKAVGQDFTYIWGSDILVYEALVAGVDGWIGGLINAFPKTCVEMFQAAQRDDLKEVKRLNRILEPAAHFLSSCGKYIASVKASLELVGLNGGTTRKPLLPFTAEEKEALRKVLVDCGLIG